MSQMNLRIYGRCTTATVNEPGERLMVPHSPSSSSADGGLVRERIGENRGAISMVGEGTTEIFISFLLAVIGYVGLTSVLVLTLRGRHPIALLRVVALIVLAHVAMVWIYRYDWQFDLAVRNGYAGFVIFHTALALILISTFAKERLSQKFVHISFVIVTIGAIGASFRYDVVSMYRFIVIPCGVVGGIGLIKFYVLNRHKQRVDLCL